MRHSGVSPLLVDLNINFAGNRRLATRSTLRAVAITN